MTGARALPLANLPSDVERWRGEPGTVGTVAVIGMGKIGLPLAAQYGSAGWHVIGVDVAQAVVDATNAGLAHVQEEPGLAERIADLHASGHLEATLSHAHAAGRADVVVMIVPVTLSDSKEPDYRLIDAATEAVAHGLRPGSLVIYETTLPVGDTRARFGPLLAKASGLSADDPDDGFLLAFSPERVFSGRIFADLATYPKLVGGVGDASGDRAVQFYESVLSAEVWRLERAESAEFAKLAETTYRDVNIALANEFARYAERIGVDILEVIQSANSQPYSHIHQPGIGVGGHCIPVYPHFLHSRARDLQLIGMARQVNDEQIGLAIAAIEERLNGLQGTRVLVLGLTYRYGVHELAYSRAIPLIARMKERGADVWGYDPLLSSSEVKMTGARPYAWGDASDAGVIVTQTADPLWRELDYAHFPRLEVLFDGRNSLRNAVHPQGVSYLGVGLGRKRA